MTSTIFRATTKDIASGLFPSLAGDEVPLWVDSREVCFDVSGARPAPALELPTWKSGLFDSQGGNFDSQAGLFDSAGIITTYSSMTSQAISGVHSQRQTDGSLLYIYGTASNLYRFQAGVTDDVTRASGGNYTGAISATREFFPNMWSFAQWGDWVLATNGKDKPQVWKGTGKFVPLTGFTWNKAEIVRVLGPQVVMFNTSGTGPGGDNGAVNELVFSARDNPEIWDPTTDATAGFLGVRDFNGPIIAVEPLGNNLAAYGESGLHVIQYGSDFLYLAQRGAQGIKAVSKNSIVSIGSTNLGIQESGIFQTDGLNQKIISDPGLNRWLEKNVNWEAGTRIAGVHDKRRGVVKWSLPIGGNTVPTVTLVFNYTTNSIGWEARAFTSATTNLLVDVPVVGMANGQILELTQNITQNPQWIETKWIDCGNEKVSGNQTFKYIEGLLTKWNGEGLSFSIAFGDSLASMPDWIPGEVLGMNEQISFLFREAVFIKIRFDGEASVDWTLTGFELIGNYTYPRF